MKPLNYKPFKSVLIAIAICAFTLHAARALADDDWGSGDDAADLSSPGSGATGIYPFGYGSGTLNAGTGDYYDMYITYPLEAEAHYRIRFQLGSQGPAFLTVYDGNGNYIAADFAEGSELAEIEIEDPVGSYYVRVYSPSGEVNEYNLNLYLD